MTSATGAPVIGSFVVTRSALTFIVALVAPTFGNCWLMTAVPFGNVTVWLGAPVTTID